MRVETGSPAADPTRLREQRRGKSPRQGLGRIAEREEPVGRVKVTVQTPPRPARLFSRRGDSAGAIRGFRFSAATRAAPAPDFPPR